MLKRFVISIAILPVLAASVNAYQGDWVKVAPVGGGFSIMMPSKPEEKIEPSDEFTFHLFTVTGEKAIYLASYGDYAPSIKLDPDGELLANRDNFLKGVKAKLIESRKIVLDGHPGLEFTGESDQASFKSRVYLFGNRVHQIAVAVFKGQDDTDNMNRFFASLTFSSSSNQDHAKP
jgi:hypothetical protein